MIDKSINLVVLYTTEHFLRQINFVNRFCRHVSHMPMKLSYIGNTITILLYIPIT